MQIPQATLNATQNAISFAPPVAAELIKQDNQAQPAIVAPTTADSAQSQDFGGAKQEPQPALYTRQGLVPVASDAAQVDEADELNQSDALSEKAASEQNAAPTKNVAGKELTLEQQEELLQLQMRDQEVRVHEQQHASVGGQHTGSPQYEFKTGPDGKQYVVEGSVPVDLSPIAGDPAATIDKMRQVKAAALAPAQPSSADKNAAAAAESRIAQATAELMQGAKPVADEEPATGSLGEASSATASATATNTASSATASSTTTNSTSASASTEPATTKSQSKIATDTPTAKDANGQMELRNQVIAGVYGKAAQTQSQQQLLSLA